MDKTLYDLSKRGIDFLGCEHSIMAGAMSWISENNLVSAVCNAGAFGVIAAGAMPAELLEKEIQQCKEKTNKNFGVNLIVMHPDLDSLIDVCIKNRVSHVILAGGIPMSLHIEKLKNSNIKTVAFAPNLTVAKRLMKNGIDALIIEGFEAGGHIGQVSTCVLAQEILPQIKDVPVFVAGGIGKGDAMASFLLQGASGIQMGTKFVCTEECIAHENFKNSFLRASARDAVSTIQVDPDFRIIPVRALYNKGSYEFIKFQNQTISEFKEGKISKEDAQLKIEHYWAGALNRAVFDGDVEYGSLMAGQSVGMCDKILSTKDLLIEFIKEAEYFLNKY